MLELSKNSRDMFLLHTKKLPSDGQNEDDVRKGLSVPITSGAGL